MNHHWVGGKTIAWYIMHRTAMYYCVSTKSTLLCSYRRGIHVYCTVDPMYLANYEFVCYRMAPELYEAVWRSWRGTSTLVPRLYTLRWGRKLQKRQRRRCQRNQSSEGECPITTQTTNQTMTQTTTKAILSNNDSNTQYIHQRDAC